MKDHKSKGKSKTTKSPRIKNSSKYSWPNNIIVKTCHGKQNCYASENAMKKTKTQAIGWGNEFTNFKSNCKQYTKTS